MCIAIYAPKGRIITRKHLENSFDNNPDGAGIAIRQKKSIKIIKGFFDFEKFYAAYMKYAGKSDMLVHCRIATSGGVSAGTCHPFPICDNIELMKDAEQECKAAMIHNGIISACNPPKKADYSDTMVFVRDILSQVDANNKAIQVLLKDYIGYSKIAVMKHGSPTVLIGNWTEDEGIYYSNGTYSYGSYLYKNYDYGSLGTYSWDVNTTYTGTATTTPATTPSAQVSTFSQEMYVWIPDCIEDDITNVLETLEEQGCAPIDYFTLPETEGIYVSVECPPLTDKVCGYDFEMM